MNRITIGAALLAVSVAASHTEAATVNVTYLDGIGYGFYEDVDLNGNGVAEGVERRAALEYAVNAWGARIDSSQAIEVEAMFENLGGGASSAALAFAQPIYFFVNFEGAPAEDVYYPSALANALAGTDLNPARDIQIAFNDQVDTLDALGSISFYYGLDENPGSDISFIRTALHEFAHGLGFTSIMEADGSFAFVPTYPSVYDQFLVEDETAQTAVVGMTQGQRQAAQVSDNLFWNGPNVVAAFGDVAPVYAPSPTYESGSSVSHFKLGTFAPPEMMEPALTGASFNPGLADELFEDLGYNVFGPFPTVSFDALSPVAIDEGDSAMIEIQLSGAAVVPTQVSYSIVPLTGSPQEGVDFTITPSSASIPTGQASATLTINALGDAVNEGAEQFELRISGPIGAEFGSANLSRTITINNVASSSVDEWMLY